MAVVKKLTPQELVGLKRTPRELSTFWRSYFEKITLELNKQFFGLLKENLSVRYVHRDIIRVEDYLEDLNGSNQLYTVLPQGSIGMLHFPTELVNYLLHHSMGGIEKYDFQGSRELGALDQQMINHIMEKVVTVLSVPFEREARDMQISLIDQSANDLVIQGIAPDEYMSIQQFSITVHSNTFYFELVLSNQLLESFTLL
jgi:flagellar motor switch protein FliM